MSTIEVQALQQSHINTTESRERTKQLAQQVGGFPLTLVVGLLPAFPC